MQPSICRIDAAVRRIRPDSPEQVQDFLADRWTAMMEEIEDTALERLDEYKAECLG